MQEHFLFWPLWKCKVLHCGWLRSLGCLISPKCLLDLNNSKSFSLCPGMWLFPARFCHAGPSSLAFKFSRIVRIWESIAAPFQTFVSHGEQTLVEKDSPSSRTTKSSFFSRSANFGTVSPFLVGATNTFSELIHLLIKLPNCVLKFYNLSEALGSFGLLPLRGAGTGFVGVLLPLPLIFDPLLYILHFTEKQY